VEETSSRKPACRQGRERKANDAKNTISYNMTLIENCIHSGKIIYLFALINVIMYSCSKENGTNDPFSDSSKFKIVNPVSLKEIPVNSIVVDGTGVKWIGTDSGLFLLNVEKWYEYLGFVNLKINHISAHDNEILLATSMGSYTFSIENNDISLKENINKDKTGSASDSTFIYGYGIFDKKWIGSPDGLAYFDGNAWKRNEEIRDNVGGISDVRSMAFRVKDGFFGTYGKFLFHFTYAGKDQVDAISGASQMIGGAANPKNNFNGELTTDTIYCVFAGSDTSIWFGSTTGLTSNKGSTHKDNGIFNYFLRGQRVHCVIEASDKKIWAGTENGIYIRSGEDWTNYNVTDGLPDHLVLCLAEDLDGSIWIGTRKGVSHFMNGRFVNY
jgi:ligand-binding sensor domain-containing protein